MENENLEKRTRLVTWVDPFELAKRMKALSGVESLKMMLDNKINPPIADLLNFQLIEAQEGKAVFSIQPEEYHYNPVGVVHGGVAATVLDAAMACAIQSLLPSEFFCTTLELKINYLRPITIKVGILRGEAEVLHFGGRTAVAQGKILDTKGKVYAYASTTFMILPISPANSDK
jgi:uncharacterized protein (TIGR00369 family)